jgi:hypothetical protein
VNIFRKVYSVVGALLVVEFLAQFFFIGILIFAITQANDDARSVYAAAYGNDVMAGGTLHVINGFIVIPITTLILIGLSFAARHSWKTTGLTSLLFLLLVVQAPLGTFFGAIHLHPLIAGLHPVNGTIMFGLGLWLLVTRWAFGKRGET